MRCREAMIDCAKKEKEKKKEKVELMNGIIDEHQGRCDKIKRRESVVYIRLSLEIEQTQKD